LKLYEEAKMKKKLTKGWALAAVGLGMMAANAPAMPLPDVAVNTPPPEVISQGHSFQIARVLPELLDFHGHPKVMADGLAPLDHDGNANPRAAIKSEMVLSGDIAATVAEPATMLIFGAGLAGLASLVRSPPPSNKKVIDGD
jgi:hypothetical protein